MGLTLKIIKKVIYLLGAVVACAGVSGKEMSAGEAELEMRVVIEGLVFFWFLTREKLFTQLL